MNPDARIGMAFHGVLGLIVLNILALLLLAGVGWWWTGPSSDELVVYSAKCINRVQILPRYLAMQGGSYDFKKYQADQANCKILPWNRTVYKLNKARGEVYYTGLVGAKRLVDCAIFSRTDWACSFPDGSGKVVIIDGLEAIRADDVKRGSRFFYLRRWQWWGATLYWWIGDTPPRGAWLIPEQH